MSGARKALLAVVLVAIVLRVGAALYLGNAVEPLPGTFDQVSYHNLALRVVDGHGFTFGEKWWPATPAGEPTAHWSYLYTLFLAGIYALFGPAPLVARLIQVVIVGIAHPLLAFWLGRELFDDRVGLVAAGLTAIYIYFIYYAAALMTEPFYITLILLALLQSIRLARTVRTGGRGIGLALQLGLTLGLIVLLRQLFLLVIPVLYFWIWWQDKKVQTVNLALSTAVIALMILPATLYNVARFDTFVLLNTNAGFAFFWGNHPVHGTRFQPILADDGPGYADLIPAELSHLDEAALDRALLARGLGFIAADPGRYLQLTLTRIPPYFMFWPSSDSSLISNVSRLASFTILLPFMILGLWQTLRQRLSLTSPIVLVLLYALAYTGIHVLTWTLVRYRLPVDGVLLVFAGLALVNLLGGRRLPVHLSRPAVHG